MSLFIALFFRCFENLGYPKKSEIRGYTNLYAVYLNRQMHLLFYLFLPKIDTLFLDMSKQISNYKR